MKENKNIVSFAWEKRFDSGGKLTHVVANSFFFIYDKNKSFLHNTHGGFQL